MAPLSEWSVDYPISKCRSCGSPIVWGTTVATGKRMPVDAEPVVGGNVVMTTGVDGPELLVVKEPERLRRLDEGEKLWISHFSSCQQARSWRR